MSGLCTHILSDVLYNYRPRVRYVMSSPSPCASRFVFLSKLSYLILFASFMHFMDLFLRLFPLFLWVLQIYPQSEKCLVLGLAPCQFHQRKIMMHNPATSSLRDSLANQAMNRHFHKCAAFMNRVSNNIAR